MSLINVNSLAGLSKISSAYVWDTEAMVLTSNKTGEVSVLNGSFQGGQRRYNLQFKPEFQSRYAKSVSVKHSEILRMARLVESTSTNKLVMAAKGQSNQVKGWIIGSIVNGSIKLSTNPKVHVNESDAKSEIERLAITNKGTTFVKVKVENYVVSGGVQWM